MAIASSKWWITMLLASAVAGMAQDLGAIVTGQVTNAVTGAPILRAHVKLSRFEGQWQSYGALTDPEGNFTIRQ
jgi:hypothetical protein